MNILGFEITRKKAAPAGMQSVPTNWNYGWGPITESFAGAWQRNIVVGGDKPALLASSAVFACVTGISSDVAKLRVKLVEESKDGIWIETFSPSFSPVLRKPNHYQDRIQFLQSWIISKLLYGNVYVFKERDGRGVVIRLYVLHPLCVTPKVAPDGSVWYDLKQDWLSQIEMNRYGEFAIPSSEIIHDRFNTLWHPLVGVSPLFACASAAMVQASALANSTDLFGKNAIPSGILTAPGTINQENANELKRRWEENYGGANRKRTAVLGDGLKFEAIATTAEAAQLADQLKFTVEDVARAFHYPLFKLGGEYPPYDSIQALNILYYSDCLQILIEQLELCLDEGLAIPSPMGTEMDIDNLFRMDTLALNESIDSMGKWATINEQRKRGNYGKLPVGGDTVYRQEQDHSIEAISKRDAGEDPFGKAAATPTPTPQMEEPEDEPQEERSLLDAEELELLYGAEFRKELSL